MDGKTEGLDICDIDVLSYKQRRSRNLVWPSVQQVLVVGMVGVVGVVGVEMVEEIGLCVG